MKGRGRPNLEDVEAVRKFNAAMLRELHAAGHEDWSVLSYVSLTRRLRNSVVKLTAAIRASNKNHEGFNPEARKKVAQQAAAVANLAMMLADNFGDYER